MSHTPGPWKHHSVMRQLDDGSTELVADEVRAGNRPVALVAEPDDAQLIAAAPDMLATLRDLDGFLLWWFPDGPDQSKGLNPDMLTIWKSARNAIAKATESTT